MCSWCFFEEVESNEASSCRHPGVLLINAVLAPDKLLAFGFADYVDDA